MEKGRMEKKNIVEEETNALHGNIKWRRKET
jgi:hypothetical protein